MRYCPKCGASIGAARSREAYEKQEKQEKHEKHEKHEKQEKHEKEETSRFWVLLGGLILIAFGLLSVVVTYFPSSSYGAVFVVLIGVLIMIIAVYGGVKAASSSPEP